MTGQSGDVQREDVTATEREPLCRRGIKRDECHLYDPALRCDECPAHRAPQPEDFICLAMSGEGYICNLKPQHDGLHQARATSYDDYGLVVKEWAR